MSENDKANAPVTAQQLAEAMSFVLEGHIRTVKTVNAMLAGRSAEAVQFNNEALNAVDAALEWVATLLGTQKDKVDG